MLYAEIAKNPMQQAIIAQNLTKKFGDLTAVDSISFEAETGEIFGFLGPNGAGKTTTIRMLTGMISPTSGSAQVMGLPVGRNVEKLHEVIGLLTESPGFYEKLTAERNLEYFAGFYPSINVNAQIEKYLKIVGLWNRKDDRVGTFSKGMKQRLALARTLIHKPKVIFLDEPTSGLDPEAGQDVRKLISGLKGEGRTVFLSTHNLQEAESLCDRIAVIKTRLVALDTPENLRNQIFKRRIVIEMDSVSDDIESILQKLSFVNVVMLDKGKLVVEIEDVEKNRPILIKQIIDSGGMIQNVYEEKHSLEDVYLSLVNSHE